MSGPLLVRPAQAAEMLSLSRSYVYQLLGTGELTPIKVGRATLIEVEDIRRFVERRKAA